MHDLHNWNLKYCLQTAPTVGGIDEMHELWYLLVAPCYT